MNSVSCEIVDAIAYSVFIRNAGNIAKKTIAINNFEYLFELQNHNRRECCREFSKVFDTLGEFVMILCRFICVANVSSVMEHELRASGDITQKYKEIVLREKNTNEI